MASVFVLCMKNTSWLSLPILGSRGNMTSGSKWDSRLLLPSLTQIPAWTYHVTSLCLTFFLCKRNDSNILELPWVEIRCHFEALRTVSVKHKNSTLDSIPINLYFPNHMVKRLATQNLSPILFLLVPWFDLAVYLPTVAQEQTLSRQGQGLVNRSPSARSTARFVACKLKLVLYYSMIAKIKYFVTHEGCTKQKFHISNWSTLRTLIQTRSLHSAFAAFELC